jgi:hypothetical protein
MIDYIVSNCLKICLSFTRKIETGSLECGQKGILGKSNLAFPKKKVYASEHR